MTCRKTNCEKIIIFFIPIVIRIDPGLFCTYNSGCCRTMMTIGNIKCRDICKKFGDPFDIRIIMYDPECMAIIFGLGVIVITCKQRRYRVTR